MQRPEEAGAEDPEADPEVDPEADPEGDAEAPQVHSSGPQVRVAAAEDKNDALIGRVCCYRRLHLCNSDSLGQRQNCRCKRSPL